MLMGRPKEAYWINNGQFKVGFEPKDTYPILSTFDSIHFESGMAYVLYNPLTGDVIALDSCGVTLENTCPHHDLRPYEEPRMT